MIIHYKDYDLICWEYIGRFMFEGAFKNFDDTLRREAGCTTELDYTQQSF